MSLKLHHVVVLVKDLQQAIEDYKKLGFVVTPGGVHIGGISRNALILLKDGTYLELLAIRPGIRTIILKILYKIGILRLLQKSKYGITLRFYGRSFDLEEGIIDFALLSDNLSTDIAQIKNRGIFLTKPLAAGRYRPDGQLLHWKMLAPLIKELPFLITGLKPAILPDPAIMEHVNGVVGLENMILVMPERTDQIIQNFKNLLGIEPTIRKQHNYEICRFELADHFIEVFMPDNRWEMPGEIQRHGLGLFAVKFKYSYKPQEWDLNLSHGLMRLD